MKHFLKFLLITLSLNCSLSAKTLLWDLGDTLITMNRWNFSWYSGRLDGLGYLMLDGRNINELKLKMFAILDTLTEEPVLNTVICDAEGVCLPPIMCEWLAGNVDGTTIITEACAVLSELENHHYFVSKREQRLIENLIRTIFHAPTFAACWEPHYKNVALLKKCAEQVDKDGKPLHTLIIVSNFDPESFALLHEDELHHDAIFKHIQQHHCIISGSMKDRESIKPYAGFFEYVLATHNLDPKECILIDDQTENRTAATQCGITVLHPDHLLETHLHTLGIF